AGLPAAASSSVSGAAALREWPSAHKSPASGRDRAGRRAGTVPDDWQCLCRATLPASDADQADEQRHHEHGDELMADIEHGEPARSALEGIVREEAGCGEAEPQDERGD